ncbi:MAG: 4a-hydroxytetrahydrobiopterin dehydratase [bacterium]
MTDIPENLTQAGWQLRADGKAIEKRFEFIHFRRAIAFLVATSYEADRLDHHPEWFNVYNRVDVTLTTHDADGLTEKDFALANYMEKCV